MCGVVLLFAPPMYRHAQRGVCVCVCVCDVWRRAYRVLANATKDFVCEQVLKHPKGSKERGYLIRHLAQCHGVSSSSVSSWVKLREEDDKAMLKGPGRVLTLSQIGVQTVFERVKARSRLKQSVLRKRPQALKARNLYDADLKTLDGHSCEMPSVRVCVISTLCVRVCVCACATRIMNACHPRGVLLRGRVVAQS